MLIAGLLVCFQIICVSGKNVSLIDQAHNAYDSGDYYNAYRIYVESVDDLKSSKNISAWSLAQRRMASCAYREWIASPDSLMEEAINQIWWKEDSIAGLMYRSWGFFLLDMSGNPAKAKFAYERALELLENTKTSKESLAKFLYKPLGLVYSYLGEAEKAIIYHQRALEIFKEHKDYDRLIDVIIDLSGTYWDKVAYKKALETIEEGLNYRELISPMKIGILLSNKAVYLKHRINDSKINEKENEKEQFREAIATAKEALNLLEDLATDTEYLANGYMNLADLYLELEDEKMAVSTYERAFELAKIAYRNNPSHRNLAKIELHLIDLKLQIQKDYKAALSQTQQLLSRMMPGFNPKDLDENPTLDDFYPEHSIIEGINQKANVYFAQYEENRKIAFLEKAKECMRLVLEMERIFIQNYSYESAKIQMISESHVRHEQMLEILYELYEKFGDEQAKREIFTYAERSKATLLSMELSDREARASTGLAVNKEKDLLAKIAFYQREKLYFQKEGDEIQVQYFQENIDRVKQEYDELMAQVEQESPIYYQQKYQVKVAEIKDVQNSLKGKGEILIEYFYGHDALYIAAIQANSYDIFKHNCDTTFHDNLNEFISNLRDQKEVLAHGQKPAYFRRFVEQASGFYKILIDSVLSTKDYSSLILIPDGGLGYLPFEVLLTENFESDRAVYHALPYLLKQANVRYNYSATVMLSNPSTVSAQYEGDYLGIAPTYMDSDLSKLYHSQESVEEIYSLLGGKTLLNEAASVHNFQRFSPNYKVVHFYGHAETDSALFHDSWMAFSPNETTNGKTEKLYDYDIYALRIQAELAILNACKTGQGKLAEGEGVMSLARAFRFIGCQNILTSLWVAMDEPTSFMMLRYFEHLKKAKEGKSSALRLAKLDYLNQASRNLSHPFFWGNFVLVGDNEPMDFEKFSWMKWLLIGGFIGLLGRLVYIKRES